MIAGGTTMTGMSGTPQFMPPEQFDPSTYGRVTTKADVWALACVLTAMLTGGPIWPVDKDLAPDLPIITIAGEWCNHHFISDRGAVEEVGECVCDSAC